MPEMTEKELWNYLDALKTVHGSWPKVAKSLGLSKQYLSYCMRKRTVTGKLLKALKVEARYVKV
jgi:hypothetical protein